MDKEDLNKIILAIKDNSMSVSGWIIAGELSNQAEEEDTDIENVLKVLVEEIERLREGICL